jgi:hypothetical protein
MLCSRNEKRKQPDERACVCVSEKKPFERAVLLFTRVNDFHLQCSWRTNQPVYHFDSSQSAHTETGFAAQNAQFL